MIPSLVAQVEGYQAHIERERRLEERRQDGDRERRNGPKKPPKPRVKAKEAAYIALAMERLPQASIFSAAALCQSLPAESQSDSYRYVNAMLAKGLIERVKRGWYRRAGG